MKAAVEKLEVETVQQRNNNLALQQHLDHMRATLTASFQNIPLPGNILFAASYLLQRCKLSELIYIGCGFDMSFTLCK
jgi:hypothetical protein